MRILKTSDFRPVYKQQVNFYHPHNKQINVIPTLKSGQVLSPTQINSISTIAKTRSISMLTLNTINFPTRTQTIRQILTPAQ